MTLIPNPLHLYSMRRRRKKIGPVSLAVLFILGAIWTLVLYQTPSMLNILSIRYARPLSTSFMRYKSFFNPLKRIDYRWVDYDEISNYLKNAVVIAEDDRFFKHAGLDWDAIENAAKVNWARKKFAFGASTISQQLAKNLYLSPSKDPIRKFREMLLAVFLDSYLPKERILELYLNIVEWGPNIYGAEAAARHYFGSSAKNLGAEQAAFLAAILPNPVRLGRGGFRLTSRAQSILNRIR